MDSEALAQPRDDGAYRALGAEGMYLGWFWRDDWDGMVALGPEGMALDPARKWDYPDARLSDEDTERVRDLLGQIGRLRYEVLDILERYRGAVK